MVGLTHQVPSCEKYLLPALHCTLGASAGLAGLGSIGDEMSDCRDLVQGCGRPGAVWRRQPCCKRWFAPNFRATKPPKSPRLFGLDLGHSTSCSLHVPMCPGSGPVPASTDGAKVGPSPPALTRCQLPCYSVGLRHCIATPRLLHRATPSCLALRSLAHSSMRPPQPPAARPPGRP